MPKITNGNKKTRIDITIDPDLLDEACIVCQKEDRNLSNLITVALKQYIAAYKEKGAN